MLDGSTGARDALDAIAGNLAFSWTPGARALFADLAPEHWDSLDHNPTALLATLSDDELVRALTPGYAGRVERVLELLDEVTRRRTWWQRRGEPDDFLVAYFSCEFGLDDSLPIYSGGLGVLAGDHLKSAAELGLPLVGVGLLYRRGYFRQKLDPSGRQLERYPVTNPDRLPLTLETVAPSVELADADGSLVSVRAQVWRADVGRTRLYLLDTDVEGNPDWARAITDMLYGGDREHRIRQELVLGIGGVRALRGGGGAP
ncbi:MAG: alpha-glucan family phosphorylase, partial [Gaiellaceae bacterium]